jgi:hypothetical protein
LQRRSRVILEVPAEPVDPRLSSYVIASRAALPARPEGVTPRRALHTSR